MKRMGSVIGLKPEAVAEYKHLHANAWPEILAMLSACNITNYTIFLREPENLLFAYFEYVGSDFDADSQKLAQHEKTREWLAVCSPCQEPLKSRGDDEWWAGMEEVFHLD